MRKRRVVAVREEIVVITPCILERVGQDRHRGELAALIHPAREGDDGSCEPGRVQRRPRRGLRERVAIWLEVGVIDGRADHAAVEDQFGHRPDVEPAERPVAAFSDSLPSMLYRNPAGET